MCLEGSRRRHAAPHERPACTPRMHATHTQDVKGEKLALTNDAGKGHLSFSGTAGPEQLQYGLELNLHGEIDVEASKVSATPRNVFMIIMKKEAGHWPRLTQEPSKSLAHGERRGAGSWAHAARQRRALGVALCGCGHWRWVRGGRAMPRHARAVHATAARASGAAHALGGSLRTRARMQLARTHPRSCTCVGAAASFHACALPVARALACCCCSGAPVCARGHECMCVHAPGMLVA